MVQSCASMDRIEEGHDDKRLGISQKIALGLAPIQAGNGLDGEAVFDRIERELDELLILREISLRLRCDGGFGPNSSTGPTRALK